MSKSTGSYYTPEKLSAFIWDHTFKTFQEPLRQVRILEPSCGDGIFLKVASEYKTDKTYYIDAIDINKEALTQAQASIIKSNGHIKFNFIEDDFLKCKLPFKYDLILGNPPYIGKQLLSEEQRAQCRDIHIEGGLDGKNVRNIWPAFLIKAASLLNENGMMAFVLPNELLQTKYAEKIQSFLKEHFKFIQILTFQQSVFTEITQDVVIMFAYKYSDFSGVSFAEVQNLKSLNLSINFSRRISNVTNEDIKWSNFNLTDKDLEYLLNLFQLTNKVSDVCTSTPGIVSGANKFFIVDKKTAQTYCLEPFCKPIIQKATLVDRAISLEPSFLNSLENAGSRYLFIDLKNASAELLPSQIQAYLNEGVKQKYNERYKCSRRNPWYNVPSVCVPQGFIFKRSYLYPKIIKNEAGVLITDTAYSIRPMTGFDIDSIVYSFYNSLTVIFCELKGRYYSDGVLELTPKEFKSLPLPYKQTTQAQFDDYKKYFSKTKSIDKLLHHNDIHLLCHLGLSTADFKRLRNIRQMLLIRRLKKTRE